jgi:hypothetical protein
VNYHPRKKKSMLEDAQGKKTKRLHESDPLSRPPRR